MTIKIRPFEATDAEYEAIVAINNAVYPDKPDSAASIKYRDQNRDPKYLRQHFVVENDQAQIIAEATCWEDSESYVPGKYSIGFCVHPHYADQGIEASFYDYLLSYLRTQTPEPTILETYLQEDEVVQLKLFKAQEYKVAQRDPTSEIDLTETNHDHLTGTLNKMLTSGINIHTLTDMMTHDPDWQLHCYQIANAIEADIPSPDPFTPEPFEEFVKIFDHPNFLADATFFALDQDQWVGMSNLWRNPILTDRCKVGLTGVLPSHRRRGIATALKLNTFHYARQNGIRYIHTENEENNPMYALNMQLGFKPKPALLTLRKEIKE
ncbi:MAG: GNAT family N-acetyltransferase [Chloroflexota bacterium]